MQDMQERQSAQERERAAALSHAEEASEARAGLERQVEELQRLLKVGKGWVGSVWQHTG
jgi:hypothetical protein